MAFTKEEIRDLCEEAIKYRSMLVEMRTFIRAILDHAQSTYPDDKNLENATRMAYDFCVDLPEGEAKEVLAALMANWGDNERKKRYRNRQNVEKQMGVYQPRQKKEEKVKAEEAEEVQDIPEEPKVDMDARMKKYNEDYKGNIRGTTPQNDPEYGKAFIGDKQEGKDYM